MTYLCEFELYEEEGVIVASPFGLEGATCGDDMRQAAVMAVDWLRGDADLRLLLNHELPMLPLGNAPEHGGRILLVGIEASLDSIDVVPACKAAEMLGVSRSRVSQMMRSGQLLGYRKGRDAFVTKESVDARLAEKPVAGRPKKVAAA